MFFLHKPNRGNLRSLQTSGMPLQMRGRLQPSSPSLLLLALFLGFSSYVVGASTPDVAVGSLVYVGAFTPDAELLTDFITQDKKIAQAQKAVADMLSSKRREEGGYAKEREVGLRVDASNLDSLLPMAMDATALLKCVEVVRPGRNK